MSYQVLARKWRPQQFAEIVGQEHITRTLQNAIAQNRVGHAYLFVGSRGIGKTTTARIFAKALNCETGIVTEPCCECQSCREIARGASLDVIEIDGASHNKVEHIRDIRENVQYTPSRGRYKIYIIDEVHMLTPAAWNALLKTLEEPPPHVKFLFATTEPHKVLPTIVSRCQRFDLKRIPVALIAERLRDIASKENVNIDERALVAIARAADGGMRDAQSVFDQIIAFCSTGSATDTPISEEDVINVFGLASGTELKELSTAIVGNDVPAAINIIHGLADRGRDLDRLFADLVYFVRNIMICQVCHNPRQLLDVSETEITDLEQVVHATSPQAVQRILDGLMAEEGRMRLAMNKRIYMEVALIRVMHDAHSVNIEELIQRLNELRVPGSTPPANLSGTRPAPPPAPASTPTPAPVPAPATVSEELTPPKSPMAEDDRTTPQTGPNLKNTAPPPASPPAAVAIATTTPPTATTPTTTTTTTTARPPLTTDDNHNMAAQQLEDTEEMGEEEQDADNAVLMPPIPAPNPPPANDNQDGMTSTAPKPQPTDTTAAPAIDDLPEEYDLDDDFTADLPLAEPQQQAWSKPDIAANSTNAAEAWHQLIEEIAQVTGKQQLKNYMRELKPINLQDGLLQVAFDDEFPAEHVTLLQKPDNDHAMQKAFQRICAHPRARVILKRWAEGLSDEETKRRLVSSPEVQERVEKNTFVQQALDIFNGQIIDVRG